MDVGRLNNNTEFYDGYEGEPEVILSILEKQEYNLHIWDGYFLFIFGAPSQNGEGWKGFTRDYNQMERSFGNRSYVIGNVEEYLEDLLQYSKQDFETEETAACYALLCDFLSYAKENCYRVHADIE